MGLGYSKLNVELLSGLQFYKVIKDVVNTSVLIPIEDLHCTLMHDSRDPDIVLKPNRDMYTCKIVGVEQLGTPGGKYYASTLLLESSEIQKRHSELLEKGFMHSFSELILHVSICYGIYSETVTKELNKLLEEGNLPTSIILANETWNKIK
jgi:hypothetical protein